MKKKYKLWDNQLHDYKGGTEGHIIYDDLKEIEGDLYSFHEIDNGGLEEEEFKSLTLSDMIMLFDWEIHDANTENIINLKQ